ncbi:hypothetical protein [Roseitranquillus sediminis]|uniref:hypothetical protein n=1 Tax=Roseitranquillus sediminis TaxID=2809051 RepID=UPI001D0CD3A5|nr:hypothetical protein [Roseitranquillus sediminis]MBM9596135.1 hypothetical protein [Roseitranquillus sediminis]
MTLIADILMIAGALGAAFYCLVLSRRLRRFSDLEKGVGGAVAVLSMQVDDMTKTLQKAQASASQSAQRLTELTERAEDAARRLELMLASLHDLPEAPTARAEPMADAEPKPEPVREEPAPSIFSTRRIRETAA